MLANQKVLPSPVAEHGFSVLLEVADIKKESSDSETKIKNDKSNKKKEKNKYLFDTGVSERGVVYNADVDLKDIEAIILSHGHFDHVTGLSNVLNHISKKPTKVICHPDSFLRRWIVFPDGNKAALQSLDEESLVSQGAIFKKITKPNFLPEYKNNYHNDDNGCRLQAIVRRHHY